MHLATPSSNLTLVDTFHGSIESGSSFGLSSVANPPACYRSLSSPSGPKFPRSVPKSVPENGGCLRECPTGGLWGTKGPRLWVPKEFPKSVPGVSKRCPEHSGDTLGTLIGYPSDTPSDTPRFRDTLGTLRGRFGPERLL